MLDQNTDTTFSLLRLIMSNSPNLAQQVKTASVGPEERDRLPASAFADPARRLFPIHTKEQVILSSAYAEKQAHVPPEVLSRLESARDIFGVSDFTTKLAQEFTPAAETVDYLLEGRRQYRVPTTAEGVKEACAFVEKNIDKLDYLESSTCATKLVKVAAALNTDVTPKVLALAGLVKSDLTKAAEWVEARFAATEDSSYVKLAGVLNSGNIKSRSDLVKVAAALGKLDAIHGLNIYYGRKLPSPQETIFNTKEAMEPSVSVGGQEIPVAKLVSIPKETYADVLGDDILGEISSNGEVDSSKLLEILPTLPMDMQKILLASI